MEFKDYYRILGVARDADADAVKKAYRKLARKYHPDVSKEADAAARMAEVNEAYQTLSDAERRAAYDAIGQARQRGPGTTGRAGARDAASDFDFQGFDGGGNADFSDFLDEMLRRARAGGGGAGQPGRDGAHGFRMRGDDRHARVEIAIEDSFRGALTHLTLATPETDAGGRTRMASRTLEVRIPKGVRPGQMIRLAGQGMPGLGGAAAGDLFLEVAFAPHPRFRVDGVNLVTDLALAPWEAALGAVLPVELPDGSSLKVRVPQGAQPGQVVTVRGKGFPGARPTDLELQLRVVLPSAWDPRAKAQYEQMAQALPDFDARKVWAAGREGSAGGSSDDRP